MSQRATWGNDEDVSALRAWMGGEGDAIPLEEIEELWQQFSTDFCATWLLVGESTKGSFCGWLINRLRLGKEAK